MPGKTKVMGLNRFQGEEFVNTTPEGKLKDFAAPIAGSYNPPAVEAAWDSYWEAKGYYKPSETGEPYAMVIPPPNVTGTLHLGHTLMVAIEDAIIRWNRMRGRSVLWLPGTDHAGIATQVVVEKKIMREQGLSRHDIGREKFLEEVWKWKHVSGGKIGNQMRKLGASVDWSREKFTMDDCLNVAVKEAFVTMFDNKKIYRANRLVNWSCQLQSAISNLEVDHMEVKKSTLVAVPGYEKKVEIGVIHSFAYKFVNQPEEGSEGLTEIVVATTRIETMLGDVAVAVHPEDPRYKHLIGSKLVHPFIADREIVIVGDDILVDMKFGTGAVKITPAHDANDFACGKRHQLPNINILTGTGEINQNGGIFAGQPRFTCRENIITALEEKGLYRGKANNPMKVGFCSRSKDIVEPFLVPQWYVDCKDMAKRSADAVRNNELEIMPKSHEHTWFQWLDNIQDWCISRQLWWGHRIPAYQVNITGQERKSEIDAVWVVGRDVAEATVRAQALYPDTPVADLVLTQDPDVLDTWFSSGLFPFSTMGWPNKESEDLKKFFPGALLETGHDILFFWVARMVMMSLELQDCLPFDKVYLHAMVRDRLCRKMSKSRGNVIDPLDVISGITLADLQAKLVAGNLDPKELKVASANQKQEFPHGVSQCGADALRFGLLSYTGQGKDINLEINVVVSKREFCNKLWNATKFALIYFGQNPEFSAPKDLAATTAAVAAAGNNFRDRWMLHRTARVVQLVDEKFKAFEFGDACSIINRFWLNELCADYLEIIKPVLYGDDAVQKAAVLSTLYTALDVGLKILHPIMPFVTEELYHRLPGWTQESRGDLIVAKFPTPEEFKAHFNPAVDEEMKLLHLIVDESRAMRANLQLTKTKVKTYIQAADANLSASFQVLAADIHTISGAASIEVLAADAKKPDGCVSKVVLKGVEVHFEVKGLPELAAEVVRREKALATCVKTIDQLQLKINGPVFAKVKPAAQQSMLDRVAENEEKVSVLTTSIQEMLELMTPAQIVNYHNVRIKNFETEVKKQEKNLAKAAKLLVKNPKAKKALKMRDAAEAEITNLQTLLAEVQAVLAGLTESN